MPVRGTLWPLDAESYAIVVALVAGSIRALMLWRASIAVDVVNVVVLSALAEGRGEKLRDLLRGSGSAPYLEVAATVGNAALDLSSAAMGENTENRFRERLEHEARVAVAAANRRLLRNAWLDALSLIAIVFAGLNAVMNARASGVATVGLIAATLLWFSNVRGARSIGTRVYSGATALVASLLESLAAPRRG
jgi:ABC-type multidrug transport system fused ATPase/permease subunit